MHVRHAAWAAVLLTAMLAGPAQAATITVSTTADPGLATQCSLRQAITAANTDAAVPGSTCTAGSGADQIDLPAGLTGHYTLAIAPTGNPDDNLRGDLDISQNVVIAGAGRASSVIDGNGIDRVLDVQATATAVTVRDLTITGGHATAGTGGAAGDNTGAPLGLLGGAGAPGGGIRNLGGTLTITNVALTGNAAGDGGDGGGGGGGLSNGNINNAFAAGGSGGPGGAGGAILTAGPLAVTGSLLAGNAAGTGGDGGRGGTGGSATFLVDPGGNAFGGDGGNGGVGGAIAAVGPSAAVTITDSLVQDSRAGDGGSGGQGGTGGTSGGQSGITIAGAPGNGTGGSGGDGGTGGALDSAADVTISASALTGNSGGDGGDGGPGGVGGASGPGITPRPGGSGNGGNGRLGGAGGALRLAGGTVAISRSEISENSAGRGGVGGDGGTGGPGSTGTPGVSAGGPGGPSGGFSAMLVTGTAGGSVTDTTVAINTTGSGGRGGAGGAGPATSTSGSGGSAASFSVGVTGPQTTTLNRVTVAGNTTGVPGRPGLLGTAPIKVNGGSGGLPIAGGIISGAGAIVLQRSIVAANSTGQCAGVFGAGSGDVIAYPPPAVCPSVNEPPLLGPLASNGGLTRSMVPRAGSPALDVFACTGTDQRGVARAKGDGCDLGAVERSVPVVTTGAAGDVTLAGAVLDGSVDPAQVATSYSFDYGTTTAYGASTAATSVGDGGAPVAAAASLSGLAPATTYHYRLRAENADGTTAGADRTFTTAAEPVPDPPAATPPAGPPEVFPLPVAVTPAFAGVTLLSRSARLDAKGRAPVKLTCRAGTVGSCSGTLSLTRVVTIRRKGKLVRATETLGKATFTIAPAKTRTVLITIKRSARGKIVKATVKAAAKDANGTAKSLTSKLTLNPAAKKKR